MLLGHVVLQSTHQVKINPAARANEEAGTNTCKVAGCCCSSLLGACCMTPCSSSGSLALGHHHTSHWVEDECCWRWWGTTGSLVCCEKEQAKATQHLLLEGCSLLMPLAKVRRRGPLLQPGPKLKVVLMPLFVGGFARRSGSCRSCVSGQNKSRTVSPSHRPFLL